MSRKILDIEVLRGIAILFVVIHHAHGYLFSWPSQELAQFYAYFGGAAGVDLFFAISGFVIARDLLPRLQQVADKDKIRFILAFWVRRAWRLWPSAWIWLFLTLLLVFAYNDSRVFGGARANIEAVIAGLAQIANFRLAETFGQSEYVVSSVYWSLSLEEQFYIFLPLLAVALRKYFIYVISAIAIVQLIEPRTSMYAIAFRTDALCFGVLLAVISRKQEYVLAAPVFLASKVASFCFVVLLMVLLLTLGSHHLNITPYRFSFVAFFSLVLVFVASYDRDLIFYRINFIRRSLIWVGERSYAIYLTHMPCFYMVRETWHRFTGGAAPTQEQFLLFLSSASFLILLLSELNFRLIEVPFRKRGSRIASAMVTSSPDTGVRLATAEPGMNQAR